MKTVKCSDPDFKSAFLNAYRALPRHLTAEPPRYYARRWEQAYGCKIDNMNVKFNSDADYLMFVMKWS